METGIIKKKVEINAPSAKVWDILFEPENLKKWAGAFYPGTYADSTWEHGAIVKWFGGGMLGAKGRVEEASPGSLMLVRYWDDINAAEDSPLGSYVEKYELTESGGKTELAIEAGPLPKEHIEKHEPMWDKAVELIKQAAED